ncbi:hypothetical protein [Phycisphaera mikurensis]|uniref:Glycosyltransferase RgtA/B/C/D-like domain-containing protein n=1 Tax=Phycisphaera mikurensis (strain NBRC 102666 / KCTC 22515 / FYK2301M01) TaxID=1142394 RepID=I0IAY5_PHYMF|nr:hypothetical protein [Phycisphaera mikurensis]MBB6442605.1 hypothetical protein [Phycisphaera mikurensis]BAM02423.1 hypothetical protein PSMK_02640 [Phycisphaera mikurensis NBRC 102666]
MNAAGEPGGSSAAEAPCGPGAAPRVLAWADRNRRWLPPALALWFLAFSNGRWRPESDGAVALSVGRSIARGTGFTHPDGLDAPLSIGLPWIAAAGFRLLGPDSVLVPVLFVGACWAAGLAVCFLWIRRVAGRPVAVVVTGLLGVSEAWLSYGLAARADLPFAAGVLAVLLGWAWREASGGRPRRPVAGWLLVGGGLLGCAAFRSVWVVVAAAVALALAVELARARARGRLAALLLGAPAAAGLAWLASAAVRDDAGVLLGRLRGDPGRWLHRSLTRRLPELVTESLPEAVFALDVGPAATAAACVLLAAGLALAASRPLRPLWLILPALLVLQWSAYGVHDRYVLPILPLLLLGWWTLAARVDAAVHAAPPRAWKRPLRLAVPAALAAAIGMNAVALVEVLHEQRSPEPLRVYADGGVAPVAEAAAWLRANTPPAAVLLADNSTATTLAFLADRRAMSGRELEKAGVPPAAVLALEPLDDRARRAAAAAGLAAGEVRWRSGLDPRRAIRVMLRP